MTCQLVISCLTVILLAGYNVEAKRGPREKFAQTPSSIRYNFFDVELFDLLNRVSKGNVLISPISIKITLGMLMEAAGEASAEEIRTALRLPNDPDLGRKEFNKWLRSLKSDTPSTILEIANRLFLADYFSVQERYKDVLSRNYRADVMNVKFDNPKETTQIINQWVSNKTRGLIPTLVDESQISSESKMLLTNAVYFKGKWSHPFGTDLTTVKCFYNGDECRHTHMMLDSGVYNYGYIGVLDAQAVDIPYEDSRYSMLVMLPKKRNGIKQLGRDLVHVSLDNILSRMRHQEVSVQLPRFKIDYDDDLVSPLQNLQVNKIFGKDADFSGMLTERNDSVYVSNIFHSTKIIVNEEGSEAAAATGALFVPLMGGPTTVFLAEHPFLFFIRDNESGTILFAGKVLEPEKAEAPTVQSVFVTDPSDKTSTTNWEQKPGDKSGQEQPVVYHEVHTPSPPINNAVQNESSYVTRTPGRLPPPPSRLPSGFGPTVDNHKIMGGSESFPLDKSSGDTAPATTTTIMTTTSRPLFTTPPPLQRPTPDPADAISSNVKRNIATRGQVPNFVFYPVTRRMQLSENLPLQPASYRLSLVKRISVGLFDQFPSSQEVESRKQARLAQSSRDRISFLT